MKAEQKLARQRLSVLKLAEAVSNVSEACRRRGLSRTQSSTSIKGASRRTGSRGFWICPRCTRATP